MAMRVLKLRRIAVNRFEALKFRRHEDFLLRALLVSVLLISAGCGETAKPVVSPANGKVDTYFGGPFQTGGSVSQSAASFDHSANQLAVTAFIISPGASHTEVPVDIINGTFTAAETGFLAVTESFAVPFGSAIPSAQNPPITGAWAVEIPGAGALANFLNVNTGVTPATAVAAPTALAQNTACPNLLTPSPFLFVTVPDAAMLHDFADYGIASIQSQGSAVTFSVQPFLVGSHAQTPSTVTGGCSQTLLGALTAYPLNAFGSTGPQPELISIGNAGLLVSQFSPSSGSASLGAFGGGTGVIGIAEPSAPLDISSLVSAQFNGFIFSPDNRARQPGYDVTVLASAFGHHTGASQACSALQASLAANNGQGAGTVPVPPSPNSIYGGEFLTTSAAGSINDPTGASGSENCDVAIDLGAQDPNNNGLFPDATIFIGSNFPPFSASSPWTCGSGGGVCAVSFPAAAIVGQVQGHYVIFVAASSVSTPPAQLPGGPGSLQAQPVGIYLFQQM